jgi:hypothetical protein
MSLHSILINHYQTITPLPRTQNKRQTASYKILTLLQERNGTGERQYQITSSTMETLSTFHNTNHEEVIMQLENKP